MRKKYNAVPHLLHHNQIDKTAWDVCVHNLAQRQVYALSWYLDIVSPGWQALVMKGETGEYVAVMPLPVRKKYGISYLQQPLFCQQLGLYTTCTLSDSQLGTFLELIQAKFGYTAGYAFSTDNTLVLNQISGGQDWGKLYTHHLSLQLPYPQIWQGYTRDRKYNLNKARRANLKLINSQDIEPLISLFRENIAHKVYGGVAEQAYIMLRRLFTACLEKGIAQLMYATTETGNILAGGLFVYYGGHIIYLFNAADAKGRQLNARTLILDNVIQRNAETSMVLDFESPMIESIAGFYKSFGSEAIPFYEWRYNRLPLPIRLLKQARQKILTYSLNNKTKYK
ncbi:GNAT family N-acetyltransferase [Pontibacter oryzae]|uniref:GNAT family N-acetyltransferase n=1 Tax=Pontibacter oryzae TaxID=2304593 RepID=A0A399S132_9BACT|nr:GNAT family N-acetyltransferase [Pontibacter oryzae]